MRWYLRYASPARLRSQRGVAIRTRNNDTKKRRQQRPFAVPGGPKPPWAAVGAAPEFSKASAGFLALGHAIYPPQPPPRWQPERSGAHDEGEGVTMPVKKSELYSSLWSSCDALRGGMDASQYKDYVLGCCLSNTSATNTPACRTLHRGPKGRSFKDMVALKGKPNIGDQINKKIIAPLAKANKLSAFPDFNDAAKLGSGKEKVDRLTDLVAIFENPALDLSKNHAEGDDILGDAYEYLMRNFATESGKSKGQFYTPAEVSRIIAQDHWHPRGENRPRHHSL